MAGEPDWQEVACKNIEALKEGYRNDQGKERVDLVPPELVLAIGEVLGQAVETGDYPERNWERGMDWSRVYGSLTRHLLKFWLGEDIDPKSGKPHVYHIACNAAFLLTYYVRKIGTDNRNKVPKG